MRLVGIVKDVDGKCYRVFVGRAFYTLTYRERETAAKIVSDYGPRRG